MRNHYMEMLLDWARMGEKGHNWTVRGYLLGAAGGTKFEPWEAEYISNVNHARMFRGISA